MYGDTFDTNKDEIIQYKVTLIGDSSVGKTCLFRRITMNTFSERNISTIGIDKRTLNLKIKLKNEQSDSINKNENPQEVIKNFQLDLWDTAGQERYKTITKGYYRGSHALILMYDITNYETFEHVNNWIDCIRDEIGKNNEGKYLIFLLGNKLDLVLKKRYVDSEEVKIVNKDEAIQKCKDTGIIWGGECSVKDFSDIEMRSIFTDYTKRIYEKIGYKKTTKQVVQHLTATLKKKKKEGSCCNFS